VALERFTLEERPELEDQVGQLAREGWPTFLLHRDITQWYALFDDFADLQVLYCEPADAVVAVGHTVPFVWAGSPRSLPPTMAGLVDRAGASRRRRETPDTLSALAALVKASHQRRGLSAEILRSMRSLAQERGLPESGPFVVPGALQPVRIDRERDEGRYEDPNVWMRHPVS
jgi:hypothetical protein